MSFWTHLGTPSYSPTPWTLNPIVCLFHEIRSKPVFFNSHRGCPQVVGKRHINCNFIYMYVYIYIYIWLLIYIYRHVYTYAHLYAQRSVLCIDVWVEGFISWNPVMHLDHDFEQPIPTSMHYKGGLHKLSKDITRYQLMKPSFHNLTITQTFEYTDEHTIYLYIYVYIHESVTLVAMSSYLGSTFMWIE